MALLLEGANVVVTNPYIYESKSLLYNQYNCQERHCIIYSMERSSSRPTSIYCPTNGVSFCYVLAMQENGLKDAIIHAESSRLLLAKGYDKGGDADNAFEGATIYGPNGDNVADVVPAAIFVIPAGNAANSWKNALIHVEATPIVSIPRTHDGFVGATIYANKSQWVQIECNYHTMCDNLTIFMGNPSPVGTNIPSNLCLECNEGSKYGCIGMELNVNPGSNNAIQFNSDLQSSKWYWVSRMEEAVIPSISDTYCNEKTSDLLENTWYWWYYPPTNSPVKSPTASPILTAHPTLAPTQNSIIQRPLPSSNNPTSIPTSDPITFSPSIPAITFNPSSNPTSHPSSDATTFATFDPSSNPTTDPTSDPIPGVASRPSSNPTNDPTSDPTQEVNSESSPTTAGCDSASFNITAVIQADNRTIIALQDVIGDIIYYHTETYLQNISGTYLLGIFCRESVFIIFENATDNTTETTMEVTILIAENPDNELEVDRIDDYEYGQRLEAEIKDQTGEDIEVDVDLEIDEDADSDSLDLTSTFLGLDVGVQYLLVGGCLLIIMLLICSITVCCLYKIKQDNKDNATALRTGMQRLPPTTPSSPHTDNTGEDNTFPEIAMVKSTSDYELDGVDLQKNDEEKDEMIVSQDTLGVALPELPAATPSIPLQQNPALLPPELPKLPPSVPPTAVRLISDDESDSDENMYKGVKDKETTAGTTTYAD